MNKLFVQRESENLEEKIKAMRAGGKILGGVLRDLREYEAWDDGERGRRLGAKDD